MTELLKVEEIPSLVALLAETSKVREVGEKSEWSDRAGEKGRWGILETVKISCSGYPSRWSYEDFASRYDRPSFSSQSSHN